MATSHSSDVSTKIVFLLEEKSAQLLLDSLLPRILPDRIEFQCLSHKGFQTLQKSIPKKLSEWKNVRFVILHDQDDKNCEKLKSKLLQMCRKNNRPDTVVCIVCQELEAWYCGDLNAVAGVYPRFKPQKIENSARFRNPDNIVKPSKVLKEIVPEFLKGGTAETIGEYMDLNNNKSKSFQHFVKKMREMAGLSP